MSMQNMTPGHVLIRTADGEYKDDSAGNLLDLWGETVGHVDYLMGSVTWLGEKAPEAAGQLELYAGQMPATVESPNTGELVGTVTLPQADLFGAEAPEKVWRDGLPPHAGWWNATANPSFDPDAWRWFDGARWSMSVWDDDDAAAAADCATKMMVSNDGIVWCDYWPENARVPRVVPE